MNQATEPNEAQFLAALITGQAKVETVASQRTISARINITTLARVDSMAQKAGKSRNEMINMLLDVGSDEVYKYLDQDSIEELQSREIVALQTSLGE